MPDDRTRTRQARRQNEPRHIDPGAAGPSPLLEQAQAWANVAREAHQNCDQGEEAERMLERRRNTSGQ